MNRLLKLQLLAAVASVALWAIPGAGLVMLPLEYLNTHFHEMCHALIALATGGQVAFIHVYANGSGVTPVLGSNLLLTASAGYVGAAFIGGLILLAARSERGARMTLYLMGGFLSASMLLWVKGDAVGIASGILWILVLFLAGAKLKGDNLIFAAQFIGIQQCLRSIQSLYVLLQINALAIGENDALLAQKVTHIPALAWALIWAGVSVAWMGVALRPSFRMAARSSGSPASSR